MQDKKDKNKNKKNPQKSAKSAKSAAFETFPLSGGNKNPRSGTTIPPEEGVMAAKEFVEENKK